MVLSGSNVYSGAIRRRGQCGLCDVSFLDPYYLSLLLFPCPQAIVRYRRLIGCRYVVFEPIWANLLKIISPKILRTYRPFLTKLWSSESPPSFMVQCRRQRILESRADIVVSSTTFVWGILTLGTAWAKNYQQLMAIRVLLGVFEGESSSSWKDASCRVATDISRSRSIPLYHHVSPSHDIFFWPGSFSYLLLPSPASSFLVLPSSPPHPWSFLSAFLLFLGLPPALLLPPTPSP